MTLDSGALGTEEPGRPSFEPHRLRLTLPRELVPIGLLLLEGDDPPRDPGLRSGLAALDRAGIAAGGKLDSIAADILRPLAAPWAVISVELSRPACLEIATIWIRGPGATIGTSTNRSLFDLHLAELEFLPFHLATLARLGPRPCTATEPVFVDGTQAFAASLGDPAERLDDELTRWTVQTMWSEPGGFVGDRSVEVLDAGANGYWEVTHHGDRTLLTPRSVDAVLRLLADSIPPPNSGI